MAALEKHSDQFRTVHHWTLLRVTRSRRNADTKNAVAYHDLVELTGCMHIEATVRKRRRL